MQPATVCARNVLGPALVVVLVLMGCGGQTPSLPPVETERGWQSGSRLRAKVLDGGDGAVEFLGWYDSELEVDCYFSVAEDGRQRCLPPGPSDFGYVDAACEEPALAVYTSPHSCAREEPRWGRQSSTQGCKRAERIFRVTGAAPSGTVYVMSEGVCQLSRSGIDESLSIEQAAPEEFVGAEEHLEQMGEGLSRRIQEGDDGSRSVVGLRDTVLGVDCAFDAEGACRPQGEGLGYVGNSFADADCAERLVTGDACSPPNVALWFTSGTCGRGTQTYHSVGAQRDGRFQKHGDSCTQSNPLSQGTHFALGEELSVTFPAAELADTGAGRLRLRQWTASGKDLRSIAGGFVDSVSRRSCVSFEFDGVQRCVPGEPASVVHFSDEDCTRALVSISIPGPPEVLPGCDPPEAPGAPAPPPPELAMQTVSTDHCAPSTHTLFGIGEVWKGKVFSNDEGRATCSEIERAPLVEYHLAGAEVDPKTLPEMTERIE